MRKALPCMLMAVSVLLLPVTLPVCVAAERDAAVEVSMADLLNDWEKLDGSEVIFRGEAIGDVMRRGDHAWVTINDDLYSREARLEAGKLRGGNSGIGVWLPIAEAEKIEVLGRFGTVGDFVEVRGVFNATCLEHGGDFDIHAFSLTVIYPGREVDASPDMGKYLGAVFAALFAIGTTVPLLRRRRRERESDRSPFIRQNPWGQS